MLRRKGETMIELMVAIVVIAVGLFSALNVVYGNRALVQRNSDEVIAINLAREWIELGKNIRDSNWLAGSAFNQLLASGTDYSAIMTWSGATGTVPVLNFTANTTTDPGARVYYGNGMYQNAVVGSSTPYARIVIFHPICRNLSVKNNGESCALAAEIPQVGIRIESVVQWTLSGVQKTLTVYSDLYDWR
jgi:prepilin-type N-terminal cleavage/methylation domain-containing protein